MEYTVACNWDPNLIGQVDFPEVKSLFGALPDAVISGGRPSNTIKNISDTELKSYIQRVHDKGWEFDFNINSTCLSNNDSTLEGFKAIIKYLEWIADLGADAVTISNANLIHIVRKNFPNLKIKVSTFQKVNSVPQAQRFEDMGVTSIMLSEHVNRDFKLLKAIRSHVKCQLILIANVGCIYNCPNSHSHANSIAHSGAAGSHKTVFVDSYSSYCFQKRLEDPVELLKIRWIRPEDVAYYEKIGIDMLKILERYSVTELLAERMKAYHERKYDGNILDLLGQMTQKQNSRRVIIPQIMNLKEADMKKALSYFGVFSTALPDLFYIDNTKLPPDFIDGFAKRDCGRLSCDECGYCKELADKTVRVIDEQKVADTLRSLKDMRDGIADGSLLY